MKFPSGKEKFTDKESSQKKPETDEDEFTAESPVPPAASPEAAPAQEEALPLPPEDMPGQTQQGGNWGDVDEEIPSPLFGAISLVCGILGIVTCGLAAPLCAPLAIIFGHTALARGRHSPVQPPPGKTLAVIGLIIGYVSLFIAILMLIGAVFFKQPISELFEGLNKG